MDDTQDEQSWMRGGSGVSGWQAPSSKDLHQPHPHSHQHRSLESDPFAEFGEWDSGGAESAPVMPQSSSWQSSMLEHDSTFPSAYPLFSEPSVQSLSSPSNLLGSAHSFSFPASAANSMPPLYLPNHTVNDSSLPATVTKGASDVAWPSRTTTPSLVDLTSPSLSLASTAGSSSASSALSSTPSSVNTSSPVSPLILSSRDAARKPDAIRVPPFDAPSASTRPTFIPPSSLPTSLPGAPHIFSSSSDVTPSTASDSSKYQSRDMTSGTPIFSSSSMSPPTMPPRQLMPRSNQYQPLSQPSPPAAAAASPLSPPDPATSPTIAFRSMHIATGSPLVGAEPMSRFHQPHSHSHPYSQLQSFSGKERKQTSIRSTRKSVENSPMTGVQRVMGSSSSQPPTMATASIMAVPSVPSAGQTPPGSKRKTSRKLGVMIDVPVKPSAAAAAALSGGLPGLTPPKMRRSMNRAGAFSPQSFSSSPASPDRPFPSAVVATISPLTEQRTMRATGVTVASPVEANSRLAPYLANSTPNSPPIAAPLGPYTNFASSQQQGASTAGARALSPYDEDNRGVAVLQRHQHQQQQQQSSFHGKQREEYKTNDEAQQMRGPSRFTSSEQQRFTSHDELSLPSTPYSPASSAHDAQSRSNAHPSASHLHTSQSPWARQYSAPATAPSFSHSSNESVRQLGRSDRATFTLPSQQSAMSRSNSSNNNDRSYQAADSGATPLWAEQYANRVRHNQPTTPLDNSPYPDNSAASHSALIPQRPCFLDENASSALLSTLAAKFSVMQRATSAPGQPQIPQQNNFSGRQRSDSNSPGKSMEGQRTPPGQPPHPLFNGNSSALLTQRHQQLLEHFKQSNPTLQALSPEATAFLAALMGAEQAQQQLPSQSHSMQPAPTAARNAAANNSSRPPSSPSLPSRQPFPSSHHQPSSQQGPMPPFTEKQLQQLQQHLSLQQRHLQQKLAQQLQHQGSRPATSFPSGQQQYETRHPSAGPASTGPLTNCPMSSAGCEMQFRSANEMQAHFLACHTQ